jgi:hypothetical protein
MGWTAKVHFLAGPEEFSPLHCVQTGSGAYPAYEMDTTLLSPRVKWLGCEANHSPPSRAKVINMWSYTSTPRYIFLAWWLIKHRGNFTALKSTIFWDITPCSLSKVNQHFWGIYCHLQGWRISRERNQHESRFQVPNLMSIFHHSCCSKQSVQVCSPV